MSYLHASPAALPAELVPLLLAPLAWLPHTLAACARVSRTWRHYATPRLYRHIALRDQTRLRRLVRCLTETPELCKLLQVLGE
jgi:non-ribosomal peptide synthetase component F